MSSPAESYEEYMVPTFFAPLAEEIVARARPQPGERVLDVACGTGIVARQIAPLVGPTGAVAGLDLNPAMLEVARSQSQAEGQSIEWHQGRAEALPFPDESFDLVVCQHGLQYMPDRLDATREMRRVLRPDCRVVLSVTQELWREPFEEQRNALMEQRFGVGPLREGFSLGDTGLFRSVIEGAGLRAVEIEPLTIEAHYPDLERFLTTRLMVLLAAVPSVQQLTPEEGLAMVDGLREALLPVVQDYIVGDEVVMPMHAQIAQAVR